MSLPVAQADSLGSAPILEYDRDRGLPAIPPRWRRAVYLAAMLPAGVAPFVSFTYGVSPVSATIDSFQLLRQRPIDDSAMLILLAAPFFLGLILAIRALRLLISAPDTKVERALALSLAAISAMLTLSFFAHGVFQSLPDALTDRETWIVAVAPTIICIGGLLIASLLRFPHNRGAIVPTALHAAYIANAWICLFEFWNSRDLGWWLTLISGSAMLLHVCFVLMGLMRSIRRGR